MKRNAMLHRKPCPPGNCKLCHKPFDSEHNCKFGRHESEWTDEFLKQASKYTQRELFSLGHSVKMKLSIPFVPSEVESFTRVSLIGYQDGKPVVILKSGMFKVCRPEEFIND